MLYDIQLKISNDNKSSIGDPKKLALLLQRKVRASLQKRATLFKARIKNKKFASCIRL